MKVAFLLILSSVLVAPGGASGAAGERGNQRTSSSTNLKLVSPLPYPDASCASCHQAVLGRRVQHGLFKEGSCAQCHLPSQTSSPCKGVVAPATGWKLRSPDPALCTRCHDRFGENPLHSAIEKRGGCTVCHDPHSASHEKLLAAAPEKLCAGCHRGTTAESSHVPIRKGRCLACHAPHSGPVKPLLKGEAKAICVECHQLEKLAAGGHLHGAVSQGACLGCHVAHKSDAPKLLVAQGDALCRSCHVPGGKGPPGGAKRSEKTIDLTAKVVHEPLIKGKCGDCHASTHATKTKGLLKGPQVALCLECHEKLGPAERLHGAVAEKGCTACHVPHTSDQKKLLATATPGRLCVSCHKPSEQDKHVHTPVKKSECLGCHTPHQSREKPLLRTARSGLCAECHELKKIAPEAHVHGVVKTGRCLECHGAHGGPFANSLRAEAKEQCLACHRQGAKAPNGQPAAKVQIDLDRKTVHEPVRKGDCAACHLAKHSGKWPALLVAPEGEVCASCHPAEKLAAGPHNHGALKAGSCVGCHDPHATDAPKLLVAQGRALCLNCHAAGPRATALGMPAKALVDPSKKGLHEPVRKGECQECHVQSHSSQEKFLLKADPDALCARCHDTKKVAAGPHLHAPVVAGRCSECHRAHGGTGAESLRVDGKALCLRCHQAGALAPTGGLAARGQLDLKAKSVHAPVRDGDCAACHVVTHSGTQRFLLKKAPGELCGECHTPQKLMVGNHRHAPVVSGRCTECHQVHTSDKPKLLVAEGQTLCLKCHGESEPGRAALGPDGKPAATRVIELGKKRVHDPVRTGDCQDCHVQTHASANRGLLKKPEVPLCTGCHDKSGPAGMHSVIEKKGCTACHTPHSSDVKNLLPAGTTLELCYRCHDRKDGTKSVHTAVKKGDCLGCHDPHSGEDKPLLKAERKELCGECHEAKSLVRAKEIHPPVQQGRCLECHSPHGSDAPNSLLAEGKALCLKCHAAGADGKAPKGPDGKPAATQLVELTKGRVHDPVRTGDCQDCHVQTHSAREKQLLKKPEVALCSGCHDKSGPAGTHAIIEQKGCTACHLPHSAEAKRLLKVTPVDALCYKCHQRQDTKSNVHTAVKKGECLGCHDPHAGEDKPLLKAERKELCSECHEAKDLLPGPVKHTPVVDGDCLTCHAPHDSDESQLLRQPAQKLCIQCHQAGKSGDARVGQARRIDLGQKVVHKPVKEECSGCHVQQHSGALPALLRAVPPALCTRCHTEVSNHPFNHGAVRLNACTRCHQPHTGEFKNLLPSATVVEVCFKCHVDDLSKQAVRHKPAAEGKCNLCHDAHGAEAPGSVRLGKGKESCFACHERNDGRRNVHKALDRFGCNGCHDPHGAPNAFLVVKPINKLCAECHAEQADGRHVMREGEAPHRVNGPEDPRRPGRRFSCVSCHDPHSSDNPSLFLRGGSAAEMCDGCHADQSSELRRGMELIERPIRMLPKPRIPPRPTVKPAAVKGAAAPSPQDRNRDSDGDGVVDRIDACPTKPGPVVRSGCPVLDDDSDGVPNERDNCPSQSGPADNQGCPESARQQVTITEQKLVIHEKIQFQVNKAVLLRRSFPLLDQVVAILKSHPDLPPLTIEGHTDARGEAELNRSLSLARAEAVRAYLVAKGIGPERLKAVGYGPDRPLAPNLTGRGREQNRRVEFTFEPVSKAPAR